MRESSDRGSILMDHRDTQRYKDSEVVSTHECEHGSLTTSYRPFDYTDKEIDAIIKWWEDKPGTTQEQIDKLISFWDGQKVRRDEYYFDKVSE